MNLFLWAIIQKNKVVENLNIRSDFIYPFFYFNFKEDFYIFVTQLERVLFRIISINEYEKNTL